MLISQELTQGLIVVLQGAALLGTSSGLGHGLVSGRWWWRRWAGGRALPEQKHCLSISAVSVETQG